MHKTITLRLTEGELAVIKREAHAERLSMNAFLMRVFDQHIKGFKAKQQQLALKTDADIQADLDTLDFVEE